MQPMVYNIAAYGQPPPGTAVPFHMSFSPPGRLPTGRMSPKGPATAPPPQCKLATMAPGQPRLTTIAHVPTPTMAGGGLHAPAMRTTIGAQCGPGAPQVTPRSFAAPPPPTFAVLGSRGAIGASPGAVHRHQAPNRFVQVPLQAGLQTPTQALRTWAPPQPAAGQASGAPPPSVAATAVAALSAAAAAGLPATGGTAAGGMHTFAPASPATTLSMAPSAPASTIGSAGSTLSASPVARVSVAGFLLKAAAAADQAAQPQTEALTSDKAVAAVQSRGYLLAPGGPPAPLGLFTPVPSSCATLSAAPSPVPSASPVPSLQAMPTPPQRAVPRLSQQAAPAPAGDVLAAAAAATARLEGLALAAAAGAPRAEGLATAAAAAAASRNAGQAAQVQGHVARAAPPAVRVLRQDEAQAQPAPRTVTVKAQDVAKVAAKEEGKGSPKIVGRTQLSPPRNAAAGRKSTGASDTPSEDARKATPSVRREATGGEAPGSAPKKGRLSLTAPKSPVSPAPRKTDVSSIAAALKAANVKDIIADERKVKQYARECFNKFDKDGNGSICFDELAECMRHMNEHLGITDFRDRDVANFMRRFDVNSDGSLCEAEFQQVYRYLLLAKLNEEDPTPFCRDMFLGRRRGQPSDHYEVVCVVGKGSFGVVSKVICKETRATRVLKTVDKEAALKSGLPPKIVMEEIDKLKALDHPAVLRLFEYYADATALHLITDLLPGGELSKAVEASHLKATPLKEDWVRSVFYQTCEGVAYIHGKGVMHRDLKLENIMLASMEPPQAIIIDVGLAELFPTSRADTYHSSAPTGSIPTMAPEVLMQSSTYKCDVWSLGCCLFGLCCKTPLWFTSRSGSLEAYPYPFAPPMDDSRPQLEEYLRRQKAGPDLNNTRCAKSPPSARDLILKMLTFKEEARPGMRQVLQHPWLQEHDEETPGLEPEHVDCLVNFQRSSALEEAILLDVASQLPLLELGDFRDLFRTVDVDRDGKLDAKELAEAMHNAGMEAASAKEAAKRFARLGPVEFSRFVAALVSSRADLLMPYLRDAFNRLDTDGDGYVTAAELRALLEKGNLRNLKATQTVSHMLEAFGGIQRISFEMLERHFSDLVEGSPQSQGSPSRHSHGSASP